MTFKPGDLVYFLDDSVHRLEANPDPISSTKFPLAANGYTFTPDGRHVPHGKVELTLLDSPNVTHYPLGQVQTLKDGTQIYHPTNGQPFQLIPTHKGSL
jgi:hypothetical protein